MLHDWTWLVARTSIFLFVTGCCVFLLARRMPLANPKWHRLAWTVVLLQGLMLFQFSLSIARPSWWGESPDDSSVHLASNDSAALAPVNSPVGETEQAESLPNAVSSPNVDPVTPPRTERVDDGLNTDDFAGALVSSAMTPGQDADERTQPAREPTTAAAPQVHGREPADEQVTTTAQRVASRETSSNASLFAQFAALPWGAIVQWAWVAGATGVIGVLGFNYFVLHIAMLRCRPARRSWTREMHELCMELALNHPVPLEVHPSLGPLLCWSPRGHRVVVPVGLWNQLSAPERTAVLHHELCHLRRGDLWKSLIARFVVAIHWFNPLAWLAARRFDESAEWSCDALMANESPGRVTRLASALLAVSEVRDPVPLLTASATGGPMFQRIRRLLSWNAQGDSIMQKCVWICLLMVFIVAGGTRLEFAGPQSLAAAQVDDAADASADSASDTSSESIAPAAVAVPEENSAGDPRLNDIVDRIVVGDNESLRQFVSLVRTPTGQIVMADRAALAAQYAESEVDEVSLWEQFINKHFEQRSGTWFVKTDQAAACRDYIAAVEVGESDLGQVAGEFRLVAAALDETSPQAPLLKRFLEHESAPALIYQTELKRRLHPGIEELADMFDDQLVRTQSGSYVIRPARRTLVERRMKFIEELGPPLGRFQRELAAWAGELSQADAAHRQFAETLGNPAFAEYIIFNHIYEESPVDDEDLEGMFYTLEEATEDTADGLTLNQESDQYRELMEHMERFQLIWDYRDELGAPLQQLAELIEEQDELHTKLKAVLKTDLALMSVAREMDYLPVTAAEAAHEWLSYYVTENEEGQYEITIASPEELDYLTENGFSAFREVRRRGRIVDEFAAGLADPEMQLAMQSFLGKLLLTDLVKRSAVRPEVDGLQVWFDQHFEESVDGLVLYDWAGDAIDEVLQEAADLEAELLKTDF